MKKLIAPILLALAVLLSVNTNAQINRRNTKKSVAYRGNYQRIFSGSHESHTFEIREGGLWVQMGSDKIITLSKKIIT